MSDTLDTSVVVPFIASNSTAPFHDLTIATTGMFAREGDEYKRKGLKKLICKHGGRFTTNVSEAKYLVSTEASYKSRTCNILSAESQGIPIMKLSWLIEGLSNHADWSTDAYSWSNNIQKSSPSTDESATGRIRKKGRKKTIEDGRVKGGAKIQCHVMNPSDITNVGVRVRPENAIPKDNLVKRKDVFIPLDEHCTLTTYKVYIDPKTGLIYNASLNKTAASTNTNKFYNIQVLKDPISSKFKTWTRWGRVGRKGQNATLGNGTAADAIQQFQKKFKDKSGLAWNDRMASPQPDKYVFVKRR